MCCVLHRARLLVVKHLCVPLYPYACVLIRHRLVSFAVETQGGEEGMSSKGS